MKTLKDYFDKIYVLNYIEAPKRRENILKQLEYYNFKDGVEFSYGMPYSKISAIAPYFGKIIETVKWNVGNEALWNIGKVKLIGCSLNHYTAIKTAYELGCKSVLVFEDDIIFRDNRDLIIEYLDEIPEDWNYLYFTPAYEGHSTVNIDDLNLVKFSKNKWINLKEFNVGKNMQSELTTQTGFISSAAYAMDRKAMDLYINIFEKTPITASDMIMYFYHNISQSPLNMYTTNTRLFATYNELDNLTIENNQYKINTRNIIPSSIDANTKNFVFFNEISNEGTLIWNKNKQ